ncbi:hypothetical protein D3C87_1924340 [compost metagenome]
MVKIRWAEAVADCSWVSTPVISLKGLANRLAYIRKLDSPPTEIFDMMLATPPTMAITEKVTLFTSRVVGLAREPRNWDFTPAS